MALYSNNIQKSSLDGDMITSQLFACNIASKIIWTPLMFVTITCNIQPSNTLNINKIIYRLSFLECLLAISSFVIKNKGLMISFQSKTFMKF